MPSKRKIEEGAAVETETDLKSEVSTTTTTKKSKKEPKDKKKPEVKPETNNLTPTSEDAVEKPTQKKKKAKKQEKSESNDTAETTKAMDTSLANDDPSAAESESIVGSVADSTMTSTTTTVKKAKKPKSKKPKKLSARTPSSYVLFSLEKRREIMLENPGYVLGDVSKLCGAKWKELSDKDKEPWIEKANHLKMERRKELDAIEESQPKKKKRTASSYLLFAVEHRKTIVKENSTLRIAQVSKMCGEAWQKLADEDKAQWKAKADALKVAA